MAPGKCVIHSLLAIGEISGSAGKEGEPPLEAVQQLPRCQVGETGSRQLNCKREPIQATTDFDDRLDISIGQNEI